MYSHVAASKIKGILKHMPEDFVVEEIETSGNVVSVDGDYSYGGGSGDFLHLVLIKKNIDTMAAVRRICSKLGILEKRVSYAGVKDKFAVSAQRIGIYKLSSDRVECVMKEMHIYPIGRGGKVFLGDLWGNRFTVCLRGINLSVNEVRYHINQTLERLDGKFPNYFGDQRFGGGVRPVTYPVGLEIIRGNIARAVEMYLCCVFSQENDDISSVRKIAVTDKAKALRLFPRNYVYERTIIQHLLLYEGDYRGAFMKFPFGLQKMFVHSVQSHIFNEVLKMMVDEGVCEDGLKIPLVGYLYGSRIFEDVTDKYVERVLKKEKINPRQFKLKDFSKLSSEGGYRLAFEKFRDFEILSVEEDDVCSGCKVVLRFSLPRGCYATVFLAEFFDFE